MFSDESLTNGARNRFGNAVYLELLIDSAYVCSNRVEADTKTIGNLLVTQAAHQAFQHVLLTLGQIEPAGRDLWTMRC